MLEQQEQFAMIYGAVWVFGFAIILLIVWQMRNRKRQKRLELIHQERMLAMEKGIPLPELPDLPEEYGITWIKEMWRAQTVNPKWPLGLGAIFICLGLGLSIALYFSGDAWSFGIIFIFLGIGFFLHYALTRKSAV
jgi:hypothetical protein